MFLVLTALMTKWVMLMTFSNEARWSIGKMGRALQAAQPGDSESAVVSTKRCGNIWAYYR